LDPVIKSLLALVLAAPGGTVGAPGIGDPYFPNDGNGGYDVGHYDLAVGYQPDSGVLTGTTTVQAKATQALSTFDLDFDGLTVRSVAVNGSSARWSRSGAELVVTPAHQLAPGAPLTVVVRYDGVPQAIDDPAIGTSGFVRTPDGFVVAGEPHAAATWFPVNDHPSDKASYTFHVTVPDGLQAVANGRLVGSTSANGRTTWNWNAVDPMASYLATVTVGHLKLNTYTQDGIQFTDAIDANADRPEWTPRTGKRLLWSGPLDSDTFYRRLTREVTVPAGSPKLDFWAHLNTSESSYFFVEAHTVGQDDWTTLADEDQYTRDWSGHLCDGTWPQLAHYLTKAADGSCTPTGTTGTWSADSSYNFGPDDSVDLSFDLSRYAGKKIELSLTYAGQNPYPDTDATRRLGVFLDDLTITGGDGSTSFEDDGDMLDGWTVTPTGTGASWESVAAADVPTQGYLAKAALSREPEVVKFFADYFGPYPYSDAGGIITNADLNFALETQTRPTYPQGILYMQDLADLFVQHELAHQWFGDNVSLRRWSDVWLNEGFATYAPWLWTEKHGGSTAQSTFDSFYGDLGEDSDTWKTPLTDPGAADVDLSTDQRGAMTLQVLRNRVGDDAFFKILKAWGTTYRHGNATTADFTALAERVSGRSLSDLFDAWLYHTGRPTITK
jgi:hypothetical protein